MGAGGRWWLREELEQVSTAGGRRPSGGCSSWTRRVVCCTRVCQDRWAGLRLSRPEFEAQLQYTQWGDPRVPSVRRSQCHLHCSMGIKWAHPRTACVPVCADGTRPTKRVIAQPALSRGSTCSRTPGPPWEQVDPSALEQFLCQSTCILQRSQGTEDIGASKIRVNSVPSGHPSANAAHSETPERDLC